LFVAGTILGWASLLIRFFARLVNDVVVLTSSVPMGSKGGPGCGFIKLGKRLVAVWVGDRLPPKIRIGPNGLGLRRGARGLIGEARGVNHAYHYTSVCNLAALA
jgi:hypothetical protein